ncbi:MAG TPA: MgtC/SapB family protein [Thermomicrobiales bacterium]|jgi:putative Mg2+ transporter-C (MgtC) family protein|nr:MgtC/SapB family protein [Thermomicrobiales bacterium]
MLEELTYQESAIRIGVAVIAGSIIGFERRAKPAGFRTHGLVSLGSALFMLASLLLGEQAYEAGNTTYDPSRLASTVVQGVGFIAAGVIFTSGMRIKGLTTAASIWVAAAVGLLVGGGFWEVGLMGVLAAVIVLELFAWVEARIPGAGKEDDEARTNGANARDSG